MAKALENKEVVVIEALERLTPKQKKFAELFAVSDNASKSARLAGYSTESSDGGYQLAHNPRVLDAVAYYRELFADATQYTPEKIIKEWAQLASVDVSAFVTDDWELRPKGQLTEAQRRALVGLEVIDKKDGRTVKPKFAKVEALREIGRLLGMYADEQAGSKGLDITINLGNQVNVSVDTSSVSTDTEVGHLTIRKAQRD